MGKKMQGSSRSLQHEWDDGVCCSIVHQSLPIEGVVSETPHLPYHHSRPEWIIWPYPWPHTNSPLRVCHQLIEETLPKVQ